VVVAPRPARHRAAAKPRKPRAAAKPRKPHEVTTAAPTTPAKRKAEPPVRAVSATAAPPAAPVAKSPDGRPLTAAGAAFGLLLLSSAVFLLVAGAAMRTREWARS
jgi:hypothetical protein